MPDGGVATLEQQRAALRYDPTQKGYVVIAAESNAENTTSPPGGPDPPAGGGEEVGESDEPYPTPYRDPPRSRPATSAPWFTGRSEYQRPTGLRRAPSPVEWGHRATDYPSRGDAAYADMRPQD
eukprot:1173763-Prorocentrum_minimum.AAC.1